MNKKRIILVLVIVGLILCAGGLLVKKKVDYFQNIKNVAIANKVDVSAYSNKLLLSTEEEAALQKKIDDAKAIAEAAILKERIKNENPDTVPILMYHFFTPPGQVGPDRNWMDIALFESHLQMFQKEGITPITVEQYKAWYEGTGLIPEKSVLITIDDGQPGTYELAAPLLEKYGYTAVSFEITSMWNNYDERKATKSIEMHSHTHDMHRGDCGLTKSGMMQCTDIDTGVADLNKAKEIMNPTDDFFCYPFGGYEKNAQPMLKAAGYNYAVTVNPGVSTRDSNPMELPRVRVTNTTTPEDLLKSLEFK